MYFGSIVLVLKVSCPVRENSTRIQKESQLKSKREFGSKPPELNFRLEKKILSKGFLKLKIEWMSEL